MIKVFVDPTYSRKDNSDGGIRRVSEALHKYLRQYGIEPVLNADEADIINNHGTALTLRPGVPVVNSNHGLYWSCHEWPDWGHEANRLVAESMSVAIAHTAPSKWVASALTRGMLVYPVVIYHGIDSNEWRPGTVQPYVLWNKARQDAVSNPKDMNHVAELMPKVKFISTFGMAAANVKVTGRMPVETMRSMVASAGVYLATARETFGIGTLEALSCGVPVAGWNWGGQSEIIVEGETGYLAEPGDYEQLAECISKCMADRARLSANARQDAVNRWGWEQRIEQYAALFCEVYERYHVDRPKVSVIVTCHNLAHYLPAALQSIQQQTLRNWECIVVDDASIDDTDMVTEQFGDADSRIKYHRTPENLKLPGALNYGISRSTGQYIMNLDADNWLDPLALEVLSVAMDNDPTIHIAYGHLDVATEDGSSKKRNPWPYPEFSWRGQMGHLNQMHSSAMYRREVWERVGGYRRRMWRAEDAEFWCRATSFGFRAKKVTELSTLIYRDRSDSKSKSEKGDGNWCAWFPWSFADSGPQGAERVKSGKGPFVPLVPWGAPGPIPRDVRFWYVHDHTNPLVSVVIPVGPGHRRYLIDALDSLIAQTFQDWEAIVVYDDGGNVPTYIAGAPYARLYSTGESRKGPGHARNLGAQHARGEVLYFLDADDYLLPDTLNQMVVKWRETGNLIYGDWLRNDSDGTTLTHYEADEFVCGAALKQMQHSVNVLVPKAAHAAIGGFDESMSGWEDWDYCIALQAELGLCSVRVPAPLFVYRFRAGTRRESSFGDGKELKSYIYNKWQDYYTRKKALMCGGGCGGSKKKTPVSAAPNGNGSKPAVVADTKEAVKLVYLGPDSRPTFKGKHTDRLYRFDNTDRTVGRWVHRDDAAEFLTWTRQGRPLFQRIDEPAPVVVTAEPKAPEQFTDKPIEQKAQISNLWPTMDIEEVETVVESPVPEPVSDMPFPLPAEIKPVREVKPVLSVLNITVVQLRELVKTVDDTTLLTWQMEEMRQKAPRTTVLDILQRARNRLVTA